MDVWNDRIIDIGLNVLEYLIAGGLGILMYSVFGGRRSEAAKASASVPTPAPAQPELQPGIGLNCEFVSFSDKPARASEPQVEKRSGRRRDRQEIIRMAREMLKSGTTGDLVKRTLPISEGELALLQNGNNK